MTNMEYLLIPIFGILNTLRGRDILSPALFAALCSAAITYMSIDVQPLIKMPQLAALGLVALISLIGILNWRQWGMDFASIHGWKPVRGKAIFADWFADLFAGRLITPANNRRWGTFWMVGRGLYAFPMFLALFWVNPWSPLLGLGMAAQGLIYGAMRWIPEKHAVMVAEIITGAWLGLLITIAMG